MADKEPDIYKKQAAAQFGESEPFVIPVAPPPVPPGPRRPSPLGVTTPSTPAGNGNNSPVPPIPTPVTPKYIPLPALSTPPPPKSTPIPQIPERSWKSAPWFLVGILACLLVGLLFEVSNNSNEAKLSVTAAIAQSQDHESELAAAQKEAAAFVQPPPPQPKPEVQNNVTIHRIAGLINGDYVNIRSGPGANNAAVARLQNGDTISVVGPSVTNGNEMWVPCVINVSWTDPSTGVTQPVKQDGWVNGHFLEW